MTAGGAGWDPLRRAAALFALLATSCLVTDPVEYGEENIAPIVRVLEPEHTFTRVPTRQPDAEPHPYCAQSGVQAGMIFQVQVLDANVTDVLSDRLVINGEVNFVSFRQPITTTGTMDRGPIFLCIPTNELGERCNHVEYLVSRAFTDRGAYATEDPDDWGKVEWWVLGSADSWPDAEGSDCEQRLNGGGVR